MIKVNAMGDACPIPVVKTKNAIRELQGGGTVETLVDNEIAVQNLTKMANQKGYDVHSEKVADNEFKVTMTINAEAAQIAANSAVATIEEEEKERKEEYNKSPKGDYESRTPESSIYATIRELYNSVCGSYPRLVKMSDARKKAINARLKTGYTLDDFRKLFEKAEASDFLKGANKRNWSATFDWMICDSNMAKVLDGNYDPKDQGGMNDEPEPTNSVQLW